MPRRNADSVASRWEWLAAALSALLVIGLLAVLAAQAFGPEVPPDLRVSVDAIERAGAHNRVRFTVRNRGTETAAELLVEGELRQAGAVVERSSVVLDYVPGGAERSGGLLFAADPRAHTLAVVPRGYQEP